MAFEQQAEYNTGGGNLLAALYNADGGAYTQNRPKYDQQINSTLADFAAQFKNLVGRDPDENERGAYLGNLVGGSGLDAFRGGRGLELNQLTSNYIGNTFGQDIEQRGLNELQGQQAEAQRLGDLFRTQGNQAINDTEGQLLNYQNKLFERLRPNLITSLQSQGLLNSGGLNQAMAGAQSDLATAGSEELRGMRLANEQQANAIQFGGQTAPYEYQKALAQSRVPMAQGAATTGLNNAYGTFMNQLNYQNQIGLMNHQASLQPRQSGGFFSQVGSALAPSLGQALGQNFASALNPASYYGAKK
jgi:hypothetical protein